MKKLINKIITADIGNQYYGENHPMKPHRIRLTHNLMMNYGLHKKMLIYVGYKLLLTTFL